jgi:hypothetical protein
MGPRRGAVISALTLLAACGGGKPAATPIVTFTPPADTILTAYVNVPAAAWLGGTKWAVVAGEFNEAAIVDFTDRTVRKLGTRQVEIRNPFGVYASGDTAWVTDWGLGRATAWTTAGQPAGTVTAAAPLRGALPSARDAAGNLYFLVKPVPGRDGRGNRDSAAVVRSGPAAVRFDTVARLSPLDMKEIDDETGHRFERRVFSGEDEWGVLRDGTVWVARVYPNQITVLTQGREPRKGPKLPDRVIEVASADREHFLLQFPEELRPTAERLPFAPIKPPFENALATPSGRIWLEKSRPAPDTVRSYHVTDQDGRLLHLAVFPSRQGHVIALSDSVALVAEQYKGGVRLMQARVPR